MTQATFGPLHDEAVAIDCGGERLWGVLTRPAHNDVALDVAMLVVVGGPQYRVGSHRQFVRLARAVASCGVPCLRFDYRGMGDSEGALRSFEQAGDDLQAALDALARLVPQARRLVVWGLCDAAAAAMMFATADPRVAGLVLANPWARSDATLGAARVKHYYGARLLEREFWAKLLGGRFDWRASWRSLRGNLGHALRRPAATNRGSVASFQSRMAAGLRGFTGRALLLVSEKDLTALEFLQYTSASPEWRGLLQRPGLRRADIAGADHTFSSRPWAERVEAVTCQWLQELAAARPSISEDT
ncbi:hydrolase 1, exosortase A system-associated [Variovorax sp. YR752]|uniref:hydrolase 1, exosortase A system-associated n=1 Tax=Variovorax sp. YR752 TaxID=1884383 RepID=UPI0031381A06